MKLLKKFLTLSRAKQIGIVVILTHCLIVLSLTIHHFAIFRSPPKRPIVVRSRPPSPQAIPQKVQKSTSSAKPSPKKTSPPAPKIASKPKKSAPPPKPVPKADSSQLLEEISSSFEALAAKSEPKPLLSLPSHVIPKAEIEKETPIDINYGEALIGYLQSVLDLPEFGEVKALIEIDRFGHILRCDILQTKSRQNGDFLKQRLPELSFPTFNEFGIASSTLEFTITFRNAETR
ncbi:MAG TPA: hypothetical protein VLE89_00795 [Chlamydiales bacterium]|nr:hypothetical protein [Chlamydiales bacterium]